MLKKCYGSIVGPQAEAVLSPVSYRSSRRRRQRKRLVLQVPISSGIFACFSNYFFRRLGVLRIGSPCGTSLLGWFLVRTNTAQGFKFTEEKV